MMEIVFWACVSLSGLWLMLAGLRGLARAAARMNIRRQLPALAAQARVNVAKQGTWPGRYCGHRRS
jgi:hypothetical protein